jgi:hypothetical protein
MSTNPTPVAAAMLAKQAAPAAPALSEIESLRAQLAEAQQKLNAAPSTQPSAPATKQFPKYIMPLSNCNICLPNGKRIFTSDGVIVADSFMLEQYLEEMVAAGNCSRFVEGDAVSSFQKPATL